MPWHINNPAMTYWDIDITDRWRREVHNVLEYYPFIKTGVQFEKVPSTFEVIISCCSKRARYIT